MLCFTRSTVRWRNYTSASILWIEKENNKQKRHPCMEICKGAFSEKQFRLDLKPVKAMIPAMLFCLAA